VLNANKLNLMNKNIIVNKNTIVSNKLIKNDFCSSPSPGEKEQIKKMELHWAKMRQTTRGLLLFLMGLFVHKVYIQGLEKTIDSIVMNFVSISEFILSLEPFGLVICMAHLVILHVLIFVLFVIELVYKFIDKVVNLWRKIYNNLPTIVHKSIDKVVDLIKKFIQNRVKKTKLVRSILDVFPWTRKWL
jgi:hypothetical protein